MCDKSSLFDALFGDVQQQLQARNECHESIKMASKELEAVTAQCNRSLHKLHATFGKEGIARFCSTWKENLALIHSSVLVVEAVIPARDLAVHHRWAYANSLQQLSLMALLSHFLEANSLLSLDDVKNTLLASCGLPLDIEDYLLGLCAVPGELSRMAQNAVIANDFVFPLSALTFVREIQRGLSQLDFRNDLLRRKSDGVKHELSKLEQITYDLRVNKLLLVLDDDDDDDDDDDVSEISPKSKKPRGNV